MKSPHFIFHVGKFVVVPFMPGKVKITNNKNEKKILPEEVLIDALEMAVGKLFSVKETPDSHMELIPTLYGSTGHIREKNG